jgi:integrase
MANLSNFTISKINKMVCPPDKQQVIYWDSNNAGYFGIRVTQSQAKSFIIQTRLNKQTIRQTIGNVNQITIKDALEIAQTKLLEIKKGNDPRIAEEQAIAKTRADKAKGVNGLVAWGEYIKWGKVRGKRGNQPWGLRHAQEHENMVRVGGKILSRGVRAGKSKIQANGVLYDLLNQPLKEISRDKVEQWLESYLDRPATARLSLALLSAFFSWLSNHKDYKNAIQLDACVNLLKSIPKPKAKKDFLQKEQVKVWFEHINRISNKVIKSYLQILVITGARRNELASLKWQDVDLTWYQATIRDKVNGTRQIPITPYVAKLIDDLPRVNDYVFCSPRSETGYIAEPRYALETANKNAGIPHLSIHGLRRTFKNLSEWVEMPVGIVAQIMGHEPSATAEKHYTDRPIDLLRVWHTKIEKFILDEAEIIQPTWEELKEQKKLRLVK